MLEELSNVWRYGHRIHWREQSLGCILFCCSWLCFILVINVIYIIRTVSPFFILIWLYLIYKQILSTCTLQSQDYCNKLSKTICLTPLHVNSWWNWFPNKSRKLAPQRRDCMGYSFSPSSFFGICIFFLTNGVLMIKRQFTEAFKELVKFSRQVDGRKGSCHV